MKQTLVVWHPESPGIKQVVHRNWLQRLLYPKEFATLSESIKASQACMK